MITAETEVWNVEPERYAPHFVSKYHLAREDDCIAKCSPRIILNLPLPDRGIGFGGPISFGDGGRHIYELEREDVCLRCIPGELPESSTSG